MNSTVVRLFRMEGRVDFLAGGGKAEFPNVTMEIL